MAWVSLLSLRNNLWKEVPIDGLKDFVSPADLATLRKQLTVLTEAGLIEEFKEETKLTSKASQPPQRTVNKQVRFCLDYQQFQQRTLPSLYDDRNIEKGLNCLVGNQYYSVLALVSGIYQLPDYPGERKKPYSVRPLGFYEYERMQPGYCENLASYQKLMESVLGDLNTVELLVHLDYIILFGKTFTEHTARLEKVLGRLQDAGFKLSKEHSTFCFSTVSYAGHCVSEAGISIDVSKKEVLTKWPKPRTASELQCYVEFCTYYRQFVSGFRDLVEPLNEILQEAADHKAKNTGRPWWATESIEERWTKEREEAFYRLKVHLLQATFVPRANMTQPEAPRGRAKKQP